MIAVDTSVIVRYLVGTPEDQAARANALMDSAETVGVSVLVLMESAHVLRTLYGVARHDVIDAMLGIASRSNIVVLGLSREATLTAMTRARELQDGPLPDALIVAMAQAAGALPVYSFD